MSKRRKPVSAKRRDGNLRRIGGMAYSADGYPGRKRGNVAYAAAKRRPTGVAACGVAGGHSVMQRNL